MPGDLLSPGVFALYMHDFIWTFYTLYMDFIWIIWTSCTTLYGLDDLINKLQVSDFGCNYSSIYYIGCL